MSDGEEEEGGPSRERARLVGERIVGRGETERRLLFLVHWIPRLAAEGDSEEDEEDNINQQQEVRRVQSDPLK